MWLKKLLLASLIATTLTLALLLPEKKVTLSQVLLCPVCSGQSLFESNHPIALGLSESISGWESEGWEQEDISRKIEEDYGPGVRSNDASLLQWLIYFCLFLTGLRYGFKKHF